MDQPLSVMGKFDAMVESKHNITCATIYVVKGVNGSLLSYNTATELGLIKIVNHLNDSPIILTQYSKVFKGIGKLKDTTIKLHIDESVQPVKQTHRRIPFHV